MSFSLKAIEVVNITNGSDIAVEMSCNLTLEGTPKPQAHPRLGRNGFFCTPGKKCTALKAVGLSVSAFQVFDCENCEPK